MSVTKENKPNPRDLDDNYTLLAQIKFEGIWTRETVWRREGNTAIARFGDFEDATHFVHGYLDFWKAFKTRDTDESIRLRGKVREEYLPKQSLVEQVEIPQRQNPGTPVEIKIPLGTLDKNGLYEILEAQERSRNRPKATTREIPPASRL